MRSRARSYAKSANGSRFLSCQAASLVVSGRNEEKDDRFAGLFAGLGLSVAIVVHSSGAMECGAAHRLGWRRFSLWIAVLIQNWVPLVGKSHQKGQWFVAFCAEHRGPVRVTSGSKRNSDSSAAGGALYKSDQSGQRRSLRHWLLSVTHSSAFVPATKFVPSAAAAGGATAAITGQRKSRGCSRNQISYDQEN